MICIRFAWPGPGCLLSCLVVTLAISSHIGPPISLPSSTSPLALSSMRRVCPGATRALLKRGVEYLKEFPVHHPQPRNDWVPSGNPNGGQRITLQRLLFFFYSTLMWVLGIKLVPTGMRFPPAEPALVRSYLENIALEVNAMLYSGDSSFFPLLRCAGFGSLLTKTRTQCISGRFLKRFYS